MPRFCRTVFTNGKGNNLFQFFYGDVLSRRHGMIHLHSDLDLLGVKGTYRLWHSLLPYSTKITTKNNDFSRFLHASVPGNLWHRCYPEDYTLYLDHLDEFRARFPPRDKLPAGNLAIHVRLGDRLIRQESYAPDVRLNLDSFCRAIDQFGASSVTIFTDMPVWREITPAELSRMKFHVQVSSKRLADYSLAADFFNELVRRLSCYQPSVRLGFTVSEDFQEMRRFPSLLFQHGTLSWWAAAIGQAERVGVYKHWRRGIELERNLAEIPLPGWFGWE